ncbi:ubiquitin carboxyl-terminal hydrolase MINDY-1/2 [Geosmithia morbida]|uniref:Ubiquitin carboxyl-terminal hydrolase MINDY-1/2 n=1 Tax=Geosmithia morbida TaxID=1094350 RepID=A0A9P4YPQ3_9HYPO|nr:ubiquitin carboxyl-terminal hydrolase MINDY-1/2 [Geosmithia morbida]KAF4119542.1 ubiquitin carboxyl-terminal hydrolase MINDY-1/2 [Geosmithia morbida]
MTAPAREPDSNDPSRNLTRQDSWEIYSDESDGEDSELKAAASNGTQTGTGSGHNTHPAPVGQQQPQGTGSSGPNGVPDALLPGGGRAQTNPFLRNKSSQSSVAPPTEALSRLRTTDAPPNPWQQHQQLGRSGTVRSASDYGTPPATSTSGTNPWESKPLDRDYSPALDFPDDSPVAAAPAVRLADPSSVWELTSGIPAHAPDTTTLPPATIQAVSYASPAQPPTCTRGPSAPPILDVSAQPTGIPSISKAPSPQPPPKIVAPIEAGASQDRRSRSHSPAIASLPSDDDSTWADVSQGQATTGESNAWTGLDAFERPDKGKERAAEAQVDEWKLVDLGEGSAVAEDRSAEDTGEQRRARPSTSGNDGRWLSPRPAVDTKTEMYQIKKIKWNDATTSQNPRPSPILVQNANGPCPLVALVNALSLTTPADVDDASLVDVLRSREQISLNLLLDAVFEELMSPRRTNPDAPLPDVGDLYAFLMSLHTGMNVNPRFIPSREIRQAYARTSLTQLRPSDRGNLIPGTFENTHEMSLYATFKIPLIHGWLPQVDDVVYGALERQAQSYEDAQNLLFRQEELEMKLSDSTDGLTGEEQLLYQDIVTIRAFLDSSATQLTPWGIDVISKAIRPGTFAILFRNDHFSTLYCHPQTLELVTLVTDEGYRSYPDVVWESLVDTSGQRTQYLSGDFKVIDHGQLTTLDGAGNRQSGSGGDWTAVRNRRGGRGASQAPGTSSEAEAAAAAAAEPGLDAREQEDRDMALALQLQEEEDQRQREDARREREQRTTNQYIEQQGRRPYGSSTSGTRASSGNHSIAPARRSSNVNTYVTRPDAARPQHQRTSPMPAPPASPQNIRPMLPPRGQDLPHQTADVPPPYEQAAHDEPFRPPMGHPSHETSSTDVSGPSTSNASVDVPPGRPGRYGYGQRPSAMGSSTSIRPSGEGIGRNRDRDCRVM